MSSLLSARGPCGPCPLQCSADGHLLVDVAGGETFGFGPAPAAPPCSTSEDPLITISYPTCLPSGGASLRSRHLYEQQMTFLPRPCQIHTLDFTELQGSETTIKLYDAILLEKVLDERISRKSVRQSLRRVFHCRQNSVAPQDLEAAETAADEYDKTVEVLRESARQEEAMTRASEGDLKHSCYSIRLRAGQTRFMSFPAGISFAHGVVISATGVEYDPEDEKEGSALLVASLTA